MTHAAECRCDIRWMIVVLIALGGTGPLIAAESSERADWPQWRGETVDGVTPETLPGITDGNVKLTVAWRQSIGVGFGTVSVRNDRLYVMGWKDGHDHLYCLDPADGSDHWTQRYAEAVHDNMHRGGPSGTPAVDDHGVYTISKSGVVQCFSVEDGQPKWRIDGPQEFGVTVPSWGFSGSPILYDDQTVIADLGRIVALDRATGRLKWKSQDFGAGYSTPVPFESHRRSLLAAFPARGLVVLDAANGKLTTAFPWKTSYDVHAATPVVRGNAILITSGYGSGAALLRLGRGGLKPVWQSKVLASQMSSPVLVYDHVYGFNGGRLVCVKLATGERRWAHRGLGQGSLVVAGRHLVVLSEDGRLVIAPVSTEGFHESASLDLFNADQGWVMPVVAGGRIFCRSGDGELATVTVTVTD